jgi:hypothetical protein
VKRLHVNVVQGRGDRKSLSVKLYKNVSIRNYVSIAEQSDMGR